MIQTVHRFFTISLFIGAFTGLNALAATGAPDLAFHPVTAWELSSSEAGCALSSRFNNGFTFSFQGAGARPDTLSIDFRQAVFTPGQNYTLSLRVPGIAGHDFQAEAQSRETLRLSLSGQEALFDALKSHAVADISVAGNTFRFYLSGFSPASQRLKTCGRHETMPEVKTARTPGPSEQAQQENSQPGPAWDPENLLSESKKESAAPPIQSAARMQAIDEFNVDFSDEALGLEPVEKKPEPASPEKETVKAQKPQPPLSSFEIPAGTASKPDRQDTEKKEPSRAARLIRKLASGPQESPKAKVNKETIAFEADFSTREPGSGDEWGSGDRKADPYLIRKISELESIIRELEQENTALNNELQRLSQETRSEQASIASQNWNLERATQRYNEAERQIKKIGEQLQKERARCAAEKRELEAMLFDPQVTDQKQLARLAELEQKLRAAQTRLGQCRTE